MSSEEKSDLGGVILSSTPPVRDEDLIDLLERERETRWCASDRTTVAKNPSLPNQDERRER